MIPNPHFLEEGKKDTKQKAKQFHIHFYIYLYIKKNKIPPVWEFEHPLLLPNHIYILPPPTLQDNQGVISGEHCQHLQVVFPDPILVLTWDLGSNSSSQ